MRASTQSFTSSAGYSLLELIVLLSLFAMISAVAIPLLPRAIESTRLEGASEELTRIARRARAIAIRNGRDVVLTIDPDKRTFGLPPPLPSKSFEPGIEMSVTSAGQETKRAGVPAIRFFPDGSSTGARIVLSSNGSSAQICVGWLTSNVRRGADC